MRVNASGRLPHYVGISVSKGTDSGRPFVRASMDERTRQLVAKIQRREDLLQLEANARRLGKFDEELATAIEARAAEIQPPKVRKPRSTVHDTGGEAHSPSSNPPWSRNELILALDLYLRLRGQSIGTANTDVAEISSFLRRLAKAQDREGIGTFRNENGVRMKLMNLRRLDPQLTAEGKTGLRGGNRLEEEIWDEFASDPEKLKAAVQDIRSQLD